MGMENERLWERAIDDTPLRSDKSMVVNFGNNVVWGDIMRICDNIAVMAMQDLRQADPIDKVVMIAKAQSVLDMVGFFKKLPESMIEELEYMEEGNDKEKEETKFEEGDL